MRNDLSSESSQLYFRETNKLSKREHGSSSLLWGSKSYLLKHIISLTDSQFSVNNLRVSNFPKFFSDASLLLLEVTLKAWDKRNNGVTTTFNYPGFTNAVKPRYTVPKSNEN